MARRRFSTQNYLKSTARVVYLPQFREGTLEFNSSEDLISSEYIWKPEGGFWPNMPVILGSDGIPWELGNLYLLTRLNTFRSSRMDSLQDRAKSLCFYLKFLEEEGLDPLDFPEQERKRPTYRFRYKLESFIDLGMAPSTARKHMGHVIGFYKDIVNYGIVNDRRVKVRMFKASNKSIKTLSGEGISRTKLVETTDLSVKVTSSPARQGRLIDGGELRPLSVDEVGVVLKSLDGKLCAIETELMIRVALGTGMRIQSICTMRKGHVIEAYEKLRVSGELAVRIGSHNSCYPIDTKYGKRNEFIFPKAIVERLYVYVNSIRYKERASLSYYGDTEGNYIFISERLNPYYTARSEVRHRQRADAHWSVDSPEFKIQSGASARANLRSLVSRIKKANPGFKSFTFHDLRATFGMNIVRRLAKDDRFNIAQIELVVKAALNHSSINTTRGYIEFDATLLEQMRLTNLFETEMLDGYKVLSEIYRGDELC